MRTKPARLLCLGLSLLGLSLAAGCAKSAEDSSPLPPLEEAYKLLDRGENSRAILLLERYNRRNAATDESKVLLASAYLGESGVDIYKIYDTFRDLIFSKSLSENFWTGPTQAIGHEPSHSADPDLLKTLPEKPAPIQQMIVRLDHSLLQLQKVVTFLDRFPDVKPAQWGLLSRALDQLDGVEQTRDVRLYRIFIRLIHTRAFLSHEVVGATDFGSRAWGCRLDLSNLKENILWVLEQFILASDDLHAAFPEKSGSLDTLHAYFAAFYQILQAPDNTAPAGTSSGLLELEKRFKSGLRCDAAYYSGASGSED